VTYSSHSHRRHQFYDSKTKWTVGRITRHPTRTRQGAVLVRRAAYQRRTRETLVGGSCPVAVRVEPRSALISDGGHIHGCTAVKVVRELPPGRPSAPTVKRSPPYRAVQDDHIGTGTAVGRRTGRRMGRYRRTGRRTVHRTARRTERYRRTGRGRRSGTPHGPPHSPGGP